MHVWGRKRLLAAVMLVCAFSAAAQQDGMRVDFRGDKDRLALVGTIRQGDMLYASLNDLAGVLGIGAKETPSPASLELSTLRSKIKITPSNPYLIIVDDAHKESFVQLPVDVMYLEKSYYVPLVSFLAAAGSWFPSKVEYEPKANTLHVGTARSTPYDITSVEMETKSNGMVIRIPSSPQFTDVEHWVRQDGWLYVTIAGAKADVAALGRTEPEGLVRKVVAIQSPGSVQLSFKLRSTPESAELSRDPENGDILFTLRTPGAVKPPEPAPEPAVAKDLEEKRDRWALDVIVIDAGHGGRDWGAIGVTGVKEKDVTLGVALKLGKLIKKQLSDVRIVYTRSDDRFIELDRRGKIANANGGKLFISIHCNSLPRKPNPTRGFEVYLLRPGRTSEAVSIAARENSVVQMEEGYEKKYQQLTDENFILVTMAQSAYVKSSEVFAGILQDEMESRAGVPNRGVKQAGFYVLVGASMPNVLVETAYLSNRQDEKFLKSESGQQKIAESIFSAVKKYKGQYEKLLEEGKAIGAR
ncbi:MAG TPA: N-acetylmuramoyl-L-alanine amidase [Bacteroidota bacterium]